jgi:hypothetical protein
MKTIEQVKQFINDYIHEKIVPNLIKEPRNPDLFCDAFVLNGFALEILDFIDSENKS